jgi:hypothetical protein
MLYVIPSAMLDLIPYCNVRSGSYWVFNSVLYSRSMYRAIHYQRYLGEYYKQTAAANGLRVAARGGASATDSASGASTGAADISAERKATIHDGTAAQSNKPVHSLRLVSGVGHDHSLIFQSEQGLGAILQRW